MLGYSCELFKEKKFNTHTHTHTHTHTQFSITQSHPQHSSKYQTRRTHNSRRGKCFVTITIIIVNSTSSSVYICTCVRLTPMTPHLAPCRNTPSRLKIWSTRVTLEMGPLVLSPRCSTLPPKLPWLSR